MTEFRSFSQETGTTQRDRGEGSTRALGTTVGLDGIRAHCRDVVGDRNRLLALERLLGRDNTPGTFLQALTDSLCTSLDVSAARIHLLDDQRQWIRAGSDDAMAGGIPVERSVCQYTIRQTRLLVIGDLEACDDIETIRVGGQPMRFYAGAPLITTEGYGVGVLCLLDSQPHRQCSNSDLELLGTLAPMVMRLMESDGHGAIGRDDMGHDVDRDPVTQLVGRQQLLDRLDGLILHARYKGRVVGVLAIHMRRMDRITHAHGWAATNQLRRDISERLKAGLGADEILGHTDDRTFVVMTSVESDTQGADHHWLNIRARDLLALIRVEAFAVGNDRIQPEVGIGVAIAPRDSEHAQNLMAMADEAAASAARQYIGRVRNPNYEEIASKRRLLSLEGPLRRAVARGELDVYYQPIVDLRGDRGVVGAEALMRWPQAPGDVPIGPDVFIPLAEELGLMDTMGRYAFEASCRQLRHWQNRSGLRDFWISVNVSPSQLNDPDLASRFAEIAREERVSPRDIKLEITEGVIEESGEIAAGVIDDLARVGFPLALDDFGTGHSSLKRVIDMPFRVLKVDRSFVWDSPNGSGAAVVSSLSQLAAYLQLASLGEGVETAEHEAFLHRCGYTYGQGFRYGKPVPASDFPLA